ncbi:MAG: OmpH family outer membrane protein [Bdellovibrionales bacterium]|nr:OmpH family outer membrane protein [Bdellovibrionales bacterium]
MKKILLTAVLGLASVFVFGAMAETKLGYVDMQKAIQATSTGKAAKAKLEKDFNKKKKELEKMEADLKKMSEDFEKKAMVLSDDVRGKKQAELQQEMMKYQKIVGQSQLEIQKKERELTMPIVKKLRDIIQDVAKNGGYTMILEKSEQSVLWAKEDADLTNEVIKAYEKKK